MRRVAAKQHVRTTAAQEAACLAVWQESALASAVVCAASTVLSAVVGCTFQDIGTQMSQLQGDFYRS